MHRSNILQLCISNFPHSYNLNSTFVCITGDIAIWILVAFTVDRFVAVCFPLEKAEICKARKAYMICLGIVLAAVAKNVHVFWTRGMVYELQDGVMVPVDVCGKPYLYFSIFVRPWIAFTLVTGVPFSVIGVCNASIIKALLRARKLHRQQNIRTTQQKTYYQMTIMCLGASCAFLVLVTPSIVLLIGKPYWTSRDDPNVVYDIAKAINNQLVYVNHSINFFLYCLTGKRFRRELFRLCCSNSLLGYSTEQETGSLDSRSVLYTNRVNMPKNGYLKYTTTTFTASGVSPRPSPYPSRRNSEEDRLTSHRLVNTIHDTMNSTMDTTFNSTMDTTLNSTMNSTMNTTMNSTFANHLAVRPESRM